MQDAERVNREALKATEEGRERVILFNWSGHGLVDMAAYEAYLNGRLSNHVLPEQEIHRALRISATCRSPSSIVRLRFEGEIGDGEDAWRSRETTFRFIV